MTEWKKLIGEMRDKAQRATGDEQKPKFIRMEDPLASSRKMMREAIRQPHPETVTVVTVRDGKGNMERVPKGALEMFKKSSPPAQDAEAETLPSIVKVEVLPTRPPKVTNATKREAVMAALKENPDRPNRDVGAAAGVSHTYVAKMRAELAGNVSKPKPKTKPKSGGNVSKPEAIPDAVEAGNVSKQDRRAMFMNMGVAMAEGDAQYLREACEVLLELAKSKGTHKRGSARYAPNSEPIYCKTDAENALRRIRRDDPRRKDVFESLIDWMKHNK